MDWSNFFSAVFGAIVGGLASAYAADKTHNHNVALQDYQTKRQIDGVLLAIHQELSLAGEIYAAGTGALMDRLVPGTDFHTHFFRVRGEYFRAYEGNVALVGQIENEELCKAIFRAYMGVNALMEQLNINNEYLEHRDKAAVDLQESQTKDASQRLDRWTSHLIDHGKILKMAHVFCKEAGENACRLVVEYRASHVPAKPIAISFWAKLIDER